MDIRFADCRYDLADPPAARTRYLGGHIPGAAFFDLEADLSDMSIPAEVGGRHPLPSAEQFAAAASRAGIDAETFVVAYDEGMTGGAARLWWLLRHFGHEHVAVLDGGLQAWLGPLAQGGETIEPAVFTPRERTDDLITAEEILHRLGDPGLTLVDARPTDRYRGEALGLDPVGGHIPGAVNLPLAVGAAAPPELMDADEIACYCGSGVAACATILLLERAGHPRVRLYPGSWSEWSRKDLPAEVAPGAARGRDRHDGRGSPGARR